MARSAEEFRRDMDRVADERTVEILSEWEAEIRAEEREQCARLAMDLWKSESDLTKQNGLSHGCVAVAKALRELEGEK